jgi:PAS domain S-box-containing protein
MVADITERHRTEQVVRESEQRFRLVADNAPALMWMSDTDKLCNYFNKPWLDFTGRSIDEELGNGWAEGVHPDDLQRCLDIYTQSFDRREKFKMEYRLRHHDGEYRWILDIGVPRSNQDGSFAGYIGIGVDVTDRKYAEEALAKANERLHLAIDSGSVGGWDFDLKTDRSVWFGKAHAQLGMTPGETLGSRKEFWDRVHEDDREHLRHAMRVARGKHEEFTEEFRVVWRDGTTHWLRSRGRYYYAASGEPERMLGISIDITESKQAEEALLRYAAIVESSNDGISSVTLDGVTVTWNAGAQRMFGYSENEIVGKPASIIVPPELRDQQKKILETLSAGGRIEQFETVRVSKTGKRIDVSLSISPVKDSTGKIVGCAGIGHDITKRKRSEEALRSSEQRYRLLFERNVAGVAMASLDGRLLDCNEGWARILGYQSRDELFGRHASEFYFNPAERKPLVDELFEKQVLFSRELQLRRKNGTPVWVLFNAAVHSDEDRRIVQCTMIDISEWKSAEEALSGMTRKLIESQEQERARIGRELHDDINQRLALLAVELEQLQQNPSEVEGRAQELRNCVVELSNDVQALSHDLHSSKLEYLGAIAGMKSWCNELAERHKIEISFRSDLSGSLPLEIGLPLFRVLQSAVNNAIKHSGGKRIEVELREDSSEIHLIISDSGKGFDVEAALRGKGLGLTSMKERVRLVNGTIAIESMPTRGTNIHVRVPLEGRGNAARLSA